MTEGTFPQLLSHLQRGGSFGYWWTVDQDGKKQTQWWPVERPTAIPLSWTDNHNYFNVNPSTVRRGTNQRTRLVDVAGLNCVFAEYDAKDFVTEEEYRPHLPANFGQLDDREQVLAIAEAQKTEAKARLEIYKERTLAHIEALPQAPTAIVDSGGGYHCYWLLTDTFTIDNDDQRALAREVQAAWVARVGGDAGAKDINRVLRVPGQLNQKYNPPRRVEIVRSDFTLLYEWSTILDLTAHERSRTPYNRKKATVKPQDGRREARPADNVVEQVKAAYSAFSVFDRFGWAGQAEEENRDELRLLGNKGLLVGKPEGPYWWRWSIPGQEVGGDQIDAWHYCKHGKTIDRNDAKAFWETITEMAAADGIEVPQLGGVVDPEKVRAEIPLIRDWIKSVRKADYVPIELQSAVGYRTDSTDTKVADAYLDVCAERGTFRVMVSIRSIAERAGLGSPATVLAAQKRLSGWFLTVNADGTVSLDVARRLISLTNNTEEVINLRATYSERKNDDPFLSGVSRTAKMLGNEEPGLGESILRVIDAILTHGEMTRAELIEATGKTKSAIARATLRAEKLGLLASEQEHKKAPKVYDLADGWEESIEVLRPYLKTYKLGLERAKRNAEQLIAYCNREMKRAEGEELRKLAKRKAKAEKRLRAVLPQLYEWMTPEDVERWVNTPNGKQAQMPHSMDRPHADFMMDVSQYQRRKEAENVAQINADLAGGYEHMAHYAMAAD